MSFPTSPFKNEINFVFPNLQSISLFISADISAQVANAVLFNTPADAKIFLWQVEQWNSFFVAGGTVTNGVLMLYGTVEQVEQ